MTTDFRVYFIKPEGRKTGSLGVHPDDIQALEAWRTHHDHIATWLFDTHPQTGEQLHAFRPVEGRTLEAIEARGIRNGDLCRAFYKIERRGGRPQMWFVDLVPIA